MEQPYYPEVTPSAPNPPPYSEKEHCNQQPPPPAFGPPNPIVPTQYQPYYVPYAVPSQGPVIQPLLHTTVVVPVQPVCEPTYLGYSIFTMLCCCLPLGIAALVFSIRTQDSNREGNSTEAQRNSSMARKLAHSALGIGIVLGVLFLVLRVVTSPY